MKMISLILCIFMLGCQQPYKVEFVHVVRNHKTITVETCDSLRSSIDDRLAEGISEEERAGLIDLSNRLLYISSSATVIERYVLEVDTDEILLQELLRHIWKQGEPE